MKYLLSEDEIPIDLPLDPITGEPVSPEKLLAIFPEPIVEQEVSDRERIEYPLMWTSVSHLGLRNYD